MSQSKAVIHDLFLIALVYHCRSLPVALRKIVTNSDVAVRQASIAAYNKLLIPEAIDHDFSVDGTAYSQIQPEKKRELADIAEERLKCLVWLADFTRDWDSEEVRRNEKHVRQWGNLIVFTLGEVL